MINLSPDKAGVFAEVARVLVPGGRLAIADIVATRALPHAIRCNADLWSACIGGAEAEGRVPGGDRSPGLKIDSMREMPQYQFLSGSAQDATATYGVDQHRAARRQARLTQPHAGQPRQETQLCPSC